MASDAHTQIKTIMSKIIKQHNKKYKNYQTLEKIDIIKINDPRPGLKNIIEYKPDFILQRNISKSSEYLVVFEVIDKQADIKTMADISRILAKSSIKEAIFISCSKNKGEETERILGSLLSSYSKIFGIGKDLINITHIIAEDGKLNDLDILNLIKPYLPKESKVEKSVKIKNYAKGYKMILGNRALKLLEKQDNWEAIIDKLPKKSEITQEMIEEIIAGL